MYPRTGSLREKQAYVKWVHDIHAKGNEDGEALEDWLLMNLAVLSRTRSPRLS